MDMEIYVDMSGSLSHGGGAFRYVDMVFIVQVQS